MARPASLSSVTCSTPAWTGIIDILEDTRLDLAPVEFFDERATMSGNVFEILAHEKSGHRQP